MMMGLAMSIQPGDGSVTLTFDAEAIERFDDAVLGLSSAIPFVARQVEMAAGGS